MAANPLRSAWRRKVREQSAGLLKPKELETALNVVEEFEGYANTLDNLELGNHEAPFSPLLHALPPRRSK